MKVLVSQLKANPYRDMDMYPISTTKVKALEESINQTDFWENLLARVSGNTYDGMESDELVDYLKGLDEAPEDMELQLAYGHHRLVAVNNVGIDTIDIPIKVIDDEIMLKIMANENKGDWASNMAVILETVRQVRNTLHQQVVSFEDFEAYAEVNSFFKTAKNFTAAKKIENIGYRRVHEFLGETWSENDIRFADATLKSIDTGVIDQEQVILMPSIGVMNKFITLAKTIRERTWPDFFKDLFVSAASDLICEEGATVKIVTKASTMTKKGNLPVVYLKKQKVVPFDLVKELKKLCEGEYSNTDPVTVMAPEELLELEGLGDYEGIEESVEELKESIKKTAERRETAGGGVEEEGGAEGTELGEDAVESADAQAAIDSAEAEAGAIAEPTFPTNIEVPAEGAEDRQRVEMIIQTAQGVKFQIDQLKGKMDGLLDDQKASDEFGKAFDTLFESVTQLGLEVYGKQYLLEAMETAEETM
jgi:hypothetical protein